MRTSISGLVIGLLAAGVVGGFLLLQGSGGEEPRPGPLPATGEGSGSGGGRAPILRGDPPREGAGKGEGKLAPAAPDPGAAKAFPALLRDLKDPRARDSAWQAIKRLGPAAVDPILAEVAKEDFRQGGPSWQAQATILMSELGPGAVPLLARRLQDGSGRVRLVAVLALAHMDTQAAPAREALAAAAQDPDPKVRLAARGILDRLRPRPPAPEGPPSRRSTPGGEETRHR